MEPTIPSAPLHVATSCIRGWRVLPCAILLVPLSGHAQITLLADYSDPAAARKPMHYHWDVYNRISPDSEVSIPGDHRSGICVVRPLGGTATGDRHRGQLPRQSGRRDSRTDSSRRKNSRSCRDRHQV